MHPRISRISAISLTFRERHSAPRTAGRAGGACIRGHTSLVPPLRPWEKGGEQSGFRAEGAYVGPAVPHVPAPRSPPRPPRAQPRPGGGLCVHSVLGEGVAGGCMSWGKGVTDFPFERAETPPAMRTDFWGGGRESKGVQPFPPTIQRLTAPSVPANPGRTLEEETEGSRGPTSQQMLPHLCLMGSRGGWEGGTGTRALGGGGVFNFGGHPSVGRPPAFSYC